ncbi:MULTISPECIES: serine hydrolase domain-containing protein [unclassified Pseudonocardia]|uniref:serine hydrolase domain-containing protein n=1 Tax=unclassified Pseudonocardia TaxID=2619320 RepID=UPI0025F94AC6|nr:MULTISPECIES: serine hydrolase domain-containing protein [unclassified Pseudonocardia]
MPNAPLDTSEAPRPRRRPARMRAALGLVALTLCAACAGPGDGAAAPAKTVDAATVAAAEAVVEQVMASEHVRAVILRVTVDGQEVVTKAWGESMTGVPATTDMHFRNGAMAIPYVATLLLQLVDEKVVSLDDRVSRWLPDVPWSDRVTLGQLAQMTSGYVDYVNTDELAAQQYTDPFRTWTPEDLIAISAKHPLLYEPGTNWNYSHTNYVILGLALEKITGTPVDRLLEDKVLRPLGLSNTTDPGTPAVPEPVLHAFTSERRLALHVPDGTPFSEESTYWNPSWTLTRGAIQTTDIRDAEATAVAIGTGTLLSPESYRAMTTKDLIGRTTKVDGCVTCFPNSTDYAYGLGIISSGDWLLQNPLFGGYAGAYAYLPGQKVAIAVATTFEPEAFATPDAQPKNSADYIWRKVAAVIVPNDAPPIPPNGS